MHFEFITKICNCSRLFDGPGSVAPKLGTCISYRSKAMLQGVFLSHKNITFRSLPRIILISAQIPNFAADRARCEVSANFYLKHQNAGEIGH